MVWTKISKMAAGCLVRVLALCGVVGAAGSGVSYGQPGATCVAALAVASPAGAQEVQPRRPTNFVPFRYKMSIEELKDKLSEKTMALADEAVRQMKAVNAAGKWKPSWESLDTRPVPEWFADAKLGIFLDYGPWSVAGWAPRGGKGASYPDWYEERIQRDPMLAYHLKTWGEDFRRDDFLPLLTAKDMDVQAIVRLSKECGARYFVPFARHHGGWAMWKSSFTCRNAVEMGPKRDLFREFADACRDQGLKLGLYFSLGEWEYPLIMADGTLGTWRWGKKTEPAFDSALMNGRCSGKIPVRDYATQYLMPLFKEAVDNYAPDLVWYDGEWIWGAQYWGSRDMAAYYFNRAEASGQEVTINDRYGQADRRKHGGGFYTSEFHEITNAQSRVWEECRSISQSYGYNWEDTEATSLPADELVQTFVQIVANNGNLLLIVNPRADGRIPDLQVRRLRELGQWLAVNGEAIFGSRPLVSSKQDKVFFTRSKDGRVAYAICTAWPGKSLTLKGVRAAEGSTLTLLGSPTPLSWQQNGPDLTITLPEALQGESARPCRHAWTVRIPLSQKVSEFSNNSVPL